MTRSGRVTESGRKTPEGISVPFVLSLVVFGYNERDTLERVSNRLGPTVSNLFHLLVNGYRWFGVVKVEVKLTESPYLQFLPGPRSPEI